MLSQTRHDPLGYDIRMEIVGSRDAVAVGLGQQTPLRSLEPDAPALAGPAWQTFLTRFETAYREELMTFLRVARRRDRRAPAPPATRSRRCASPWRPVARATSIDRSA